MSGREAGTGWRGLRDRHPRAMGIVAGCIALFIVIDALLVVQWFAYRRETAHLRAGMTDAERSRAELVASTEARRDSVRAEIVRRQAARDRALHLSVALDSGVMRLERDGALLREMRFVRSRELSRGALSVERVLSARDPWEVPASLFASRGVTPPADRRLPGALGRTAFVLSGGGVIYALPDSGMFADSSYVVPGALRLDRGDLRAIAPVITRGLTVYVF